MQPKKSIQTLLLGFVLWLCLWFSVEQNPMMAASLMEVKAIPPERMQTLPEATLNLEAGVDHFLTSMPGGYYTIGNVEGLKSLVASRQPLT